MISAAYHQGQLGLWLMTSWLATVPAKAHLLILPPFAEEANRSRYLFSQLSQKLSAQGWNCYLPDFYGTGDSEGDFTDCDLTLWQRDLCQWLAKMKFDQPLHLLACRFGALQLLLYWPELQQFVQTGKVLLWQPQLESQKFLQQFLRQHQASQLLQNNKSPAASEMLARGVTVEIAGYPLTPEFYQQLAQSKANLEQWRGQTVCWLELSTLPQLPVPALQAWQTMQPQPVDSCQQLLPLPPFWLQQEHLPLNLLVRESLIFLTGEHHD